MILKINLKEMGYGIVKRIHIARGRIQWLAVAKSVVNRLDPQHAGN